MGFSVKCPCSDCNWSATYTDPTVVFEKYCPTCKEAGRGFTRVEVDSDPKHIEKEDRDSFKM